MVAICGLEREFHNLYEHDVPIPGFLLVGRILDIRHLREQLGRPNSVYRTGPELGKGAGVLHIK